MIYAEIQDIMKISSESFTRILHDSLGVRKCCASEEHKRVRVDWCNHMLRKFDERRSPCFWDIVTGDET